MGQYSFLEGLAVLVSLLSSRQLKVDAPWAKTYWKGLLHDWLQVRPAYEVVVAQDLFWVVVVVVVLRAAVLERESSAELEAEGVTCTASVSEGTPFAGSAMDVMATASQYRHADVQEMAARGKPKSARTAGTVVADHMEKRYQGLD